MRLLAIMAMLALAAAAADYCRVYYFCCASCAPKFKADPHKYAKV